METVVFEKNKFVGELQEVLNSWFKEKPDVRSVASLSRATGVTDPAIRRLMNSSVKINDDYIFKLLTHICGASDYDTFLSTFGGKREIQAWFTRNFSYLKKAPAMQEYRVSKVTEDIVLNPISFSVFALVSSLPVTTVSLIKEQLGVRGEIEMEILIQKNILGIVDDKVIVRDGNKVRLDKEQTIQLLPEITRTYLKKDSIHNYRALEIEAVSQVGYGDLMDLFAKFLNDVHTIYKTKPGNIPAIVAGFVDTFTVQPYFEGDKNETPN